MQPFVVEKAGELVFRRSIIDVELKCLPTGCKIHRFGYPRPGERYLVPERIIPSRVKTCVSTDVFEEPKVIIKYTHSFFGRIPPGFYVVLPDHLFKLVDGDWKLYGDHATLHKKLLNYPNPDFFKKNKVTNFSTIKPGRYEVDENGYGFFIGELTPELEDEEDEKKPPAPESVVDTDEMVGYADQ
jgi:hypothetical protein